MFSDVPQMFSDIFRCFQMFSDDLRMLSIVHRRSLDILRCAQDAFRIFPDVQRCFQMFPDVFGCSLDVHRSFGCSLHVL